MLPHGLFAPTLLLGAGLGRAVGHITHVHLGLAASAPGVFAAIGAASMLGGFMRLTIATTVTLVELTGDLSLVLPGMLSISIARAVAGYLHKDSYDESTIASRGMAFLQDTWLAQLEHCRVSLVEKQHEMLGTLADVEGIKFAADIMMKVPVIFTASSRAHISQLVSYTERRGAFVEETKANQRSLQVRCHRAHEIRAHLRSAPPARALVFRFQSSPSVRTASAPFVYPRGIVSRTHRSHRSLCGRKPDRRLPWPSTGTMTSSR